MDMTAALKKPAVLLTGLAIGLLVLYFVGRSGSAASSGGNGFSLQSQDIATRANVALSTQTTDYNKAALQFMTAKAANAAMLQSQDMTSNTAITLRAMDSIDAAGQAAAQQNLQRTLIAGSVKLNAQKNASNFQMANLQATTAITLAPQQSALALSLANIEANKARDLANITVQGNATLATINGANRLSVQDASNNQRTTDDIFKSATTLAPYLMAFI